MRWKDNHKKSNKLTHSFKCSWIVLQKHLGPGRSDTSLCHLGFCRCPAKDEANVTHLPSGLAWKRSFQLIWLELWIWLFLMPLMLTSFGEIKASHAECITCSSRINLVQWVGLYSPLPPCTPLHLLWGILHWSLWSEMTELNFTSFKRNFRNAGPFLSSFVHDCVKIFGSQCSALVPVSPEGSACLSRYQKQKLEQPGHLCCTAALQYI